MQNFRTTENANDAEFPRTGAPPDVNAAVGPSETTASMAADPIATAGVGERAIRAGAAAPETASGVPAPVSDPTNSVTGQSQSCGAKRVLKVKCIAEMVRTTENNLTSWKPPFELEEGFEASLKEIIQRADFVRAPLQATPLPTGSVLYGTTDELFGLLQQAIVEQAFLPEYTWVAPRAAAIWLATLMSTGTSMAPKPSTSERRPPQTGYHGTAFK